MFAQSNTTCRLSLRCSRKPVLRLRRQFVTGAPPSSAIGQTARATTRAVLRDEPSNGAFDNLLGPRAPPPTGRSGETPVPRTSDARPHIGRPKGCPSLDAAMGGGCANVINSTEEVRQALATNSALEAYPLPRFCRLSISSVTTAGSARVDVSPSEPYSFSAILRRIRRMILPERVFGNIGAN